MIHSRTTSPLQWQNFNMFYTEGGQDYTEEARKQSSVALGFSRGLDLHLLVRNPRDQKTAGKGEKKTPLSWKITFPDIRLYFSVFFLLLLFFCHHSDVCYLEKAAAQVILYCV